MYCPRSSRKSSQPPLPSRFYLHGQGIDQLFLEKINRCLKFFPALPDTPDVATGYGLHEKRWDGPGNQPQGARGTVKARPWQTWGGLHKCGVEKVCPKGNQDRALTLESWQP